MSARWQAAETEAEDEEPPALDAGERGSNANEKHNADTGIKKGFFGGPSSRGTPQQPRAQSNSATSMPHVRARKQQPGTGPQIPASFQLPAEQTQRFSESIANTVSNDQQMLQDIMSNPELREAFNDQELMAAVQRISSNPQAHQHELQQNPKLANFYRRMSALLGQRFDAYSEQNSSQSDVSDRPTSDQSAQHSSRVTL